MNLRRIYNLRRCQYRGLTFVEESSPQAAEAVVPQEVGDDERYEEMKNQALRIKAEFENYRKRAQREKDDVRKFANENIIVNFLKVMDDFDRALDSVNENSTADAVLSGVKMIRQQFWNQMKTSGVVEIMADGEVFDPHFHEAVTMTPSEDVENNHVVSTFQPGYKLKDRVIRAAMVAVAKN